MLSTSGADFFDRLEWRADRMLLDGWTFRLQHTVSDRWDGGDHFMFYKIKPLVDQYATFFRRRAHFRPRRLFELGIWDGGSTAFWHELLQPERLVAVDLKTRTDSPYFTRYLTEKNLHSRILTRWNTDQADRAALVSLLDFLDGAPDLVIDDASHLYAPTKASFEALFPLMAPGSLYIIEDWAWGHWPDFFGRDHGWRREETLTRLVTELVEATGTSRDAIASLEVFQGFTVIERGIGPLTSFNLDAQIQRRPVRSLRGRFGRWMARGAV